MESGKNVPVNLLEVCLLQKVCNLTKKMILHLTYLLDNLCTIERVFYNFQYINNRIKGLYSAVASEHANAISNTAKTFLKISKTDL